MKMIDAKKEGKHSGFLPGINLGQQKQETPTKVSSKWGTLKKKIVEDDEEFKQMKDLYLSKQTISQTSKEGVNNRKMPQFLEAIELAIKKDLITHEQLDKIKEARDKEFRHLNRRLYGYNKR